MFYTQSIVSNPHFIPSLYCFLPSLQSVVRSQCFILTTFLLSHLSHPSYHYLLRNTITPYQCCQSYLKSSKTCSKAAIKISSRDQFALSIIDLITISLPFWQFIPFLALIRMTDKILFKMDNDELT